MSWFGTKDVDEEIDLARARAVHTLEFLYRVLGDKFHPDSLTSTYEDKEGNSLFSLQVSEKLDDELLFAKQTLGNEIYELVRAIANP